MLCLFIFSQTTSGFLLFCIDIKAKEDWKIWGDLLIVTPKKRGEKRKSEGTEPPIHGIWSFTFSNLYRLSNLSYWLDQVKIKLWEKKLLKNNNNNNTESIWRQSDSSKSRMGLCTWSLLKRLFNNSGFYFAPSGKFTYSSSNPRTFLNLLVLMSSRDVLERNPVTKMMYLTFFWK